jgi:hypothetical protein
MFHFLYIAGSFMVLVTVERWKGKARRIIQRFKAKKAEHAERNA